MKTGMFADIPVDVGVIYEGERIRKPDMYVEFGGAKVSHKFELLRVEEEVEDGKITVEGPELPEIKEGSSCPFAIYVKVAGRGLEREMEGVFERRIHDFCNYIEGLMHLNQRYDIWIRVSKKSVKKGLTLQHVGKVLERLFKSELPIIEKIQITFITDSSKVKEMHPMALKIYEARDARARGLKDENVSVFYGCTLCQSFAPTHVCIITPQRYANCGAISWFDGRAAAKVDPKGPIFEIKKGRVIDDFAGEYEGVNQVVKEKTLGEFDRVQLYTAFGTPHTSCGCFEGVAFYIPEVDGIGLIHRDFKGPAINGLTFSAMADSTAGGRQIDGFHGLSIEYMRSPKFLQVDGGWRRVVWVPKAVKERVKDFIPADLIDKIPTEEDVENLEELKAFLETHEHPIVERMKAIEVVAPPLAAEALPAEGLKGGELVLVLKDAKIYAKKAVIRRKRA